LGGELRNQLSTALVAQQGSGPTREPGSQSTGHEFLKLDV
jgi:hypothetical protein